MPHSRHLQFVSFALLLAAFSPLATFAQAPRAETQTVTVLDSGVEPREREMWRFQQTDASWIQVQTRTVRGPRAVVDVAKDARSLRRMYTLKGSFLRTSPITTAIWRINDAAARYHDPTNEPEEHPDGIKGSPKFGEAPPKKDNEPQGEPVNPTSNTSTAVAASESFEERFARLTNKTLKKLNGASLRQKAEPSGLIATGTIPVIEELTPRIYSEAMNLVYLLGLSEVVLPETPIGIGARWKSEMQGEVSGIPIKTTITWTLKAKEEDSLRIGVTYERRMVGEEQGVQSGRVNRDGLGEIKIDLNNPLALDARLVQLPNAGNPHSPEVSWITIKSLPLPGAVGEPAKPRDT